ncbi:MAG: M3 family metallopeptidase, partial [Planctomycetota bacterium]
MSRPDAFRSDFQNRLTEARARAERFTKESGGDWTSIARDFDAILHPLDAVRGRVELYASVDPDSAMRELGEALERDLVAFATELSLSRPIFDRLHAVEAEMQENASREPEAARLVTEALKNFRRGGVDKDEATRERVQALSQEILEIGQEFDRRIAQDTRSIEIEAADAAESLAGMPDDWVRARPAGEDGKIRITTDPQDVLPFMMYADRGDLRRELYRARISRGLPENLDLLSKMADARGKLAGLLGFDSYAALDLDDKMARSPETVRGLLERCSGIARPKAEAELEELRAVKRRLGLEEPETIYVWERGYLTEKFKEERFGLDSQCVRPYLAYARVRDGLMKMSEELFGVEFRPAPQVEVWHEDVQAFEVFEGGKLTARFFLDMHPREAKYKHAAVFPLQAGVAG